MERSARHAHIGVDIIEIGRVSEAIARGGERFLHRIFTEAELRLCGNKIPSLAARFAAKEAVMKAISAPSFGVGWQEIEILADDNGRPAVNIFGRAASLAGSLGVVNISVSLSHSKTHAIAFAVGEIESNCGKGPYS